MFTKKFLAAILSSILFCLILAILEINQQGEPEPNVYEWSFGNLMIVYLMYATPVYIIAGIPASYVIDVVMKKVHQTSKLINLLEGFYYTLAGGLSMIVFIIFLYKGRISFLDMPNAFLFGAIAAFIYYVVYSFMRKRKRN